jgi:hypothetical protein
MRAGCSAPLGIHAQLKAGRMVVEGSFAAGTGALTRARIECEVATLAQAEALGTDLADRLNASNPKPTGVGS